MNFNFLNLWASFVFCLFLSFNSYSQLPKGIIADPATGSGRVVLDPNLDGWITTTGAAFISQDSSESEILYKKMVIISEPNSDLGAGPNCGYTDFVYSTTPGMTMAGGYYLDANNNWLIRLRLSRFLPNSKSYSLMIDTDLKMGSSGVNKDPGYVNGNPGFEIEVLVSTANPGGVFIYDVNNTTTPVQKVSYTGHTNYQRSLAKSNECSDEDAFLDFFIPFAALTTHFGISSSTPLRWVLTDNMSAEESTIGHLSNISDLYGSSKYTEAGILENIENFTPTCASCTPGKLRSVCPVINSPISNGATSISGTGTDGDTIKLYKKNGTATRIPNTSTYTIVSGSAWTITGLSSIATGDSIGATATTPGRGESINNCNVAIVKSCGVIPALTLTGMTCSTKGICYSGGAAVPGASITVYYNGSLVSPYAPSTVNGSGNFGWDCVAGGCGAGGAGCLTGNSSVQVFQTVGGCISQPLCMNVVNGGSTGAATSGTFTTAPIITTNPIINGTSPIIGTCPSGALVTLFADGTQIGSVTGSTSWSITPSPSLSTDAVLSAYAKTTSICTSVASSTVTVARLSNPPVVNSAGCGTVITVNGSSAEITGSKILLYDNGNLKDSTNVASSGTWSKTSSTSYSGPITAKCRISGGTLSSSSNSVSILSQTSDGSLSITTSPITDALTTISGAGTSGNTIKLYVDGVQIGTTTVSSGSWTVSGLTAGEDLFQSGIITATSTSSGSCASNPTNNVTITCVSPADLGATSSVSTCQGSVATGIVINNSEVGTVYQLYNSATPFGEAVLGTGGTISLISETMSTSTTLSVKAIKTSSCATTFSGTIAVTVNPPDSCWYGRVSTDWFDARNWCLSGNIPTATTKTKILGSAAFMPIIAASGAVCDTMIINTGATVTTSGSQNLDVYGGWNNNGTYTANSGTVSFKDNNGQLIKGSSVTTFNNLTINNTSAAGITLQQDANVTGVLTLTDGIVNTTSTNLLSLSNTASSASASTASFVDGPMEKSGTTTFTFPVGDGVRYAPIAIGAPTTTAVYVAQYFANGYSNQSSMSSSTTPVLTKVSSTEYWQLDQTSGGNATVIMDWNNNNNSSGVSNCTDLRIAKWSGSDWQNNNNASTCPLGCGSTGCILSSSVVSSFGTFTFGSVNASTNPLPVTLVSFTGICKEDDVQLNWTTTSEINNDYFTIERGLSETDFKAIGTIKGSGNSSQLLNYQFIDREAIKTTLPGTTWFYKLKQTDFNGQFEYSSSITADNCRTNTKAILLYPNVTNGRVQVINNSDQAAMLEIYNLMGASVYTAQISNANAELCLNLPVGMYYYVLKNKDEWFGKGKLMLK